jgi:hypothetical protein
MATASAYKLLVLEDASFDKILYNTAKLKENIEIAKIQNRKKISGEILEIEKKILFLKDSIKESVDDNDFQNYNLIIEKLETILNDKKKSFENMIQPSTQKLKETHEIFLNSQFKPWVESTFEYSKTSVNSKPNFGEVVEFAVPDYGNFLSDMCLHIKISELTPESPEDTVRYANMMGHKLIKKIQLFINNNLIDEYSGEYYNVYYDSNISKDKKKAWLNCIGHEIPEIGELVQDPLDNSNKELKYISNGFQTLKDKHGEVELFIPLLFWFNTDKKCALLNNYDFGTVKIKVELEPENKLITCLDYINNRYHEKYIKPSIIECELYTNHIFVSQEIQDIFISRVGFNLIRTHKLAEMYLDKNTDSIRLNNFIKHPVEEVAIYARPEENENGLDSLNIWNKNCIMNIKYIKTPIVFKDAGGEYNFGINNIKLYEKKNIFKNVSFSYDGVSSYGDDTPLFFTSYIPLTGGDRVFMKNNDIMYFTYSMLPREYNPSGVINLSKSKQIRFNYDSDCIQSNGPIKLYVHTTNINFLIFNNISAVLNFSI